MDDWLKSTYQCPLSYLLSLSFVWIDPCSEVNCGNHASCRIEGTEAFCVCAEGWTYNPKKISAGCLGKI